LEVTGGGLKEKSWGAEEEMIRYTRGWNEAKEKGGARNILGGKSLKGKKGPVGFT